MTPQIQTLAALGIVAVTVTWLLVRTFSKKKTSSCGHDCACPTADLKAKLKP